MDARKQKIDHDGAWKLLEDQERIYIGKGKKVLAYVPDQDNRDEILKAAMGRSGNLRAPTLKTGGRAFIGFNEDIYTHL